MPRLALAAIVALALASPAAAQQDAGRSPPDPPQPPQAERRAQPQDAAADPSRAAEDAAAQARAREEEAARAKAREESLRAVREDALRQQIAQLQTQVGTLSNDLDAARARIAQLEQALSAAEQQRSATTEDLPRRAETLGSTVGALSSADSALAGGSSDDVGAAIDQARTLLAQVTARAGATGSGNEAALAAGASRDLDVAAEALRRSSLFEARVAVSRAMAQARQALAITGGGNAPAAPSAMAPSRRY